MIKDNVKCCNCEFDGLVGIGEEKCPECKESGMLTWKDDNSQEV